MLVYNIGAKGVNYMYKVNDVINFFLSRASMSPKKLQKMLYYAYSWTLALLNESAEDIHFRLFNERFEAWVHGPVIPEVYAEHKTYGWMDIDKIDSNNDSVFQSDVLDILNQVWDVYGEYTGNELEEISHKERPWRVARSNLPAYEICRERISDQEIFKYYNEQASVE